MVDRGLEVDSFTSTGGDVTAVGVGCVLLVDVVVSDDTRFDGMDELVIVRCARTFCRAIMSSRSGGADGLESSSDCLMVKNDVVRARTLFWSADGKQNRNCWGQGRVSMRSTSEFSAKRKYLRVFGSVGGSYVRRHLLAKSKSSGVNEL